jgi:hypothetical protein
LDQRPSFERARLRGGATRGFVAPAAVTWPSRPSSCDRHMTGSRVPQAAYALSALAVSNDRFEQYRPDSCGPFRPEAGPVSSPDSTPARLPWPAGGVWRWRVQRRYRMRPAVAHRPPHARIAISGESILVEFSLAPQMDGARRPSERPEPRRCRTRETARRWVVLSLSPRRARDVRRGGLQSADEHATGHVTCGRLEPPRGLNGCIRACRYFTFPRTSGAGSSSTRCASPAPASRQPPPQDRSAIATRAQVHASSDGQSRAPQRWSHRPTAASLSRRTPTPFGSEALRCCVLFRPQNAPCCVLLRPWDAASHRTPGRSSRAKASSPPRTERP